ncbi:MAG: TolC family protein, partial [Rhodothermales bacterium]|nr:TolC family protein [Rhodothermales bacterium]
LELSQASYSSGAINLVQLLDSQNNYLQAQLSRANANYNFLISALILNRYIGYFFLLRTDAENEIFRQRFFEYHLGNQGSQ